MSRKKLVIISAGAFGREVFHLAQSIRREDINCRWIIKGFLDDRPKILDGMETRVMKGKRSRILSSVEDYEPAAEDLFTCAIGDPGLKRKYAGLVRDKGGVFTNLVATRAVVAGGGAGFGSGLVIGPFSVISCNVTIGDDTYINGHVTAGHDVSMGAGCHVGAYSFIGGGVRMGDEVTINPHASILPGIEIGNGATVGAGTVVMQNVAEGDTVFGVPGRVVRV